ncbi:hypothetical protein BP6252_02256 [Coleophoma cylindrospora]|uniref:Uncharacterized protein n=1 Tax=Coleophoma cylindrospora TaxID=1849047 RepID=A0A3D8SEA3_9HELO|nr:hypothetical protein BP6252_02256 [Coleophoma cylindrospora]
MDNSTATDPITYSISANAVALPLFSALSVLISIVPFKAHWAHKNVGLCGLIVVLTVFNIFHFVNAILWPNDDFASWWAGYGWCDILAKLQDPLLTAEATTTCCITLNLARAVDIDNPISQTRAAQRRRIVIDILFCFGIPFLQILLHYFIQPSRYSIGTIFGCENTLDNSWPTLVIMEMWRPLFALLNMYFAFLVVYRLRKHRDTFANTLSSNGSNLSPRRFIRLFLFSGSLLVIYLPVVLYYFYLNVLAFTNPLYSYSWSRIHNAATWNTISYYSLSDQPGLQYDSWVGVAQSFLTFFFFGLGNEALEEYRRFLVKCGAGKIWPRLNEPVRRNRSWGRRGSSASWSSRMDVVGLTLKYFDRSRKSSQGTMSECSLHSRSRKGSLATNHDHISMRNLSLAGGHNPDAITPAPPCHARPSTPAMGFPFQPNPQDQHHARSFLGAFRTHINLPFPLIKPHNSRSQPALEQCRCPPLPSNTTDIESQGSSQGHVVGFQPLTCATVETQIWASQPPPQCQTHAQPLGPSRSSTHGVADEDEDAGPKMGTRAYRERERREMEALRREHMAERDEVVVLSHVEQTRS